MRTAFFLLGIVIAVGPANASPITFHFSGTVSQVSIDDIYGDIGFGDLIEGDYTFDSSAPDLIAGLTTGSYSSTGVPYGMTTAVAGHVFGTSDLLNIGIFDSFVDQYLVTALSAGNDLTLELFLQDATATAFSSDGLPLSPPLLSSFQQKDFHLDQVFDTGEEVQVDGQLTGLTCTAGCSDRAVPEPSTGWLAGAGALMLLALALRRSGLNPASRGSLSIRDN